MAPTEILANQHYHGLKSWCDAVGIQIKLLTGSTKKKDRTPIHNALEDGSLQVIVGTHALIEDAVVFKNLGLAIIDEQHRFGVAQRSKLWKKNTIPPHVLVMIAYPYSKNTSYVLIW